MGAGILILLAALHLIHVLLQASFGEAQKFLTSQGVNPPALVEKAGKAGTAAEGAFNQAKPSLTSSLTSLSARDPGTLAEYALGAVAVYYLVSHSAPVLMSFVSLSLHLLAE